MRCVTVDAAGHVVAVIPEPASVAECSLVLVSPSEAGQSPFVLSNGDAALIGAAVLFLWACAYVVRILSRSLWSF